MSRTDTMARLRAADPLTSTPPPEVDPEATLARILASPPETAATTSAPPAPARRRTARRIGYVAVPALAVATVTALAFALLPGGVARPLDARAVDSLKSAAQAAESAADTPLRPGQRIYQRTRNMYGSMTFKADGSTYQSFCPSLTERWITPDGATVERGVQTGPRWYPTPRDRAASLADGERDDYTPGLARQRALDRPLLNSPTWAYARSLPTDPEVLEERIRAETQGQSESADVAVWEAVRSSLASPLYPPALRAALFRIAAGLPDVRYLGEVRDRAGRPGVAVTLATGDDAHAHVQHVLIFDAHTGVLLQDEQRTRDPGGRGLPESMRDAVVGLTVYEQSAVVAGDGVRPDGTRVDVSKAPLMPESDGAS